MHGPSSVRGDRERLPTLGIGADDTWLRPFQVPPVLNRGNAVRTWNHAVQGETPVEIALISAKQLAIGLGVLWNQNHHRAGHRLSPVRYVTFYLKFTARERNCDIERSARRNI